MNVIWDSSTLRAIANAKSNKIKNHNERMLKQLKENK